MIERRFDASCSRTHPDVAALAQRATPVSFGFSRRLSGGVVRKYRWCLGAAGRGLPEPLHMMEEGRQGCSSIAELADQDARDANDGLPDRRR